MWYNPASYPKFKNKLKGENRKDNNKKDFNLDRISFENNEKEKINKKTNKIRKKELCSAIKKLAIKVIKDKKNNSKKMVSKKEKSLSCL